MGRRVEGSKSARNLQRKKKMKTIKSPYVFFMRAGFRNNLKLFWKGDQMVSWQRNDGIKRSVVGLLIGGISGYALNNNNIGGTAAWICSRSWDDEDDGSLWDGSYNGINKPSELDREWQKRRDEFHTVQA
ncbi:hypothetical protein LINPERPRIM_LOCUS31426 [Linum perenne]